MGSKIEGRISGDDKGNKMKFPIQIEDYIYLYDFQYVQINKDSGSDWFRLESNKGNFIDKKSESYFLLYIANLLKS